MVPVFGSTSEGYRETVENSLVMAAEPVSTGEAANMAPKAQHKLGR